MGIAFLTRYERDMMSRIKTLSNAARDLGGAAANRTSELYGIQMLRAVAALAVVVHHILEQSNRAPGRFSPDWLTTSGASGVDIFFVISGFIMAYVSFRPGRPAMRPGAFLSRRVTRIYPFYWLCCLAMVLLIAAGLKSYHYQDYEIPASLLLLPGNKILSASWTLVYEIYFYLLFAATLRFGSAIWSVVFTTAAIVTIYLLAGYLPPGATRAFLADPLPLEFCMGLWLALAWSAFGERGRSWRFAAPAAALGFLALAAAPLFVAHSSTNGLPSLARAVFWGIPAAVIVAAFLPVARARNVFTRSLVRLGDASYALYLTHVFVVTVYGRLINVHLFGGMPQILIVPPVVIAAIAVGLLAHLYVERPLLALIRRVMGRRPGTWVEGPAAQGL